MRLSLRFLIPLAIALGVIAYNVVPLVDQLTSRWFVRDLDIRTKLIASASEEPLIELLTDNTRDKVRIQRLQVFFNRMLQDERVFAIGYCDATGALVYHTLSFPSEIKCRPGAQAEDGNSRVIRHRAGALYAATSPVVVDGKRLGEMVIVHDMSFIEGRSADTKKYIVWHFAAIGAVIALITVIIAELSFRGWMAGIKALIRGQSRAVSPQSSSPVLATTGFPCVGLGAVPGGEPQVCRGHQAPSRI